MSRAHLETMLLALAAAVAGLWLLPLASSFWVDEAGSWWVIRDGFSPTVERSIDATGQSPLYYVTLWGWTRAFGTSEIAMRSLSLIAAVIAALLLWRLTAKLLGSDAALLGVIAFATIGGFGSVAFSAADARPYALGLVFVVGSTLALVRWVAAPRARAAALYAALLALAIYSVYTYAAVAIGHVIFLAARARHERLPTRQIIATIAGLAVALTPAALHLAAILRRPNIFESVPFSFSASRLLPFGVIAGAAVAGLLFTRAGERVRAARAQHGTGALLAGWTIIPLAALLILAVAVAPKFFYARYYLAAMPGLAVLAGWLLASLASARARAAAAVALTILALVSYADPEHTAENWRAAAATVEQAGPGTLVLLRSGFAGSKPDRLADPQVVGLVRSPLDYYDVAADIELLPFRLDTEARAYAGALLDRRLPGRRTVVFVTRAPFLDVEAWLSTALRGEGFDRRVVQDGAVRVVIFRRG